MFCWQACWAPLFLVHHNFKTQTGLATPTVNYYQNCSLIIELDWFDRYIDITINLQTASSNRLMFNLGLKTLLYIAKVQYRNEYFEFLL